MKFADIPAHKDAKVPFLADFAHNCEVGDDSLAKVNIPMSMTGKEGEGIFVQYLNPEDREKDTIGHVGEKFYAVLCNDSVYFPLPYGSALQFIAQGEGNRGVLDMEWLADLLLKCDEPFDLRDALDGGEGRPCQDCGKTECECDEEDV